MVGVAVAKDLWVHPRNEPFNPSIHYRDPGDPNGEIYYRAENDIGRALGDITIGRRGKPLVTMTVGEDILSKARASKGSIRPVLLWDSNGDGKVDRSSTGRIEGIEAHFDAPELEDVNLQLTRWQLGVRYIAGQGGDLGLDGRYLASVDSSNANIAFIRDEEIEPAIEPAKAAAQGPIDEPGLVILKHRREEPFDLAAFADDPTQFVEDFDRLSRGEDGDDWNASDRLKGALTTHFDDEDLFIVRTQGGATLEIQWGDMPMVEFFRDYLAVEPDAEGCYSSLSSQLLNDDGSPVKVPHRWFYCPNEHVALFDIPDGYEVGLAAFFKDDAVDNTWASNSIRDNVKLYAKQVNPRSPLFRATGTVRGNIGAGFRDAGSDAVDVLRHAFTGTRPQNIHTGQEAYQASTVTAVPRALYSLATLKPLQAFGELLDGVDSTIMIGASVMGVANNAVLNPLVQVTVGNAMSPQAADTTGHWMTSLTQAAAKNLPGAERNVDALSPLAQWQHNRAFAMANYTRTDTQLNIDRIITVLDISAISAIQNHNDGGGSGAVDNGDGGNGGGGQGPICKPDRKFKKHFFKKRLFKKKFSFKRKLFAKKKWSFHKKLSFKKFRGHRSFAKSWSFKKFHGKSFGYRKVFTKNFFRVKCY